MKRPIRRTTVDSVPKYQNSDNSNSKLADALEAYRLRENLTFQELADQISGIHYTSLIAIVAGRRMFARTAYRIRQFLSEHGGL